MISITGLPLAVPNSLRMKFSVLAFLYSRFDLSTKKIQVDRQIAAKSKKTHTLSGGIILFVLLSMFCFNQLGCFPDTVHGDHFRRIETNFEMIFQGSNERQMG